MTDQRTINFWALAPFGRIGHRLGWRWVYYFTFPIPYHPWLARALPLLLAAWIVWLAVRPEPVDWTAPLWAALVLAVPLSIPIFQWIFFAFRLHLIQALMLPAALLLLGAAAFRGEVQLWLIAVPVLYFGAFALAGIAGRLQIRAWRAENRKVDETPQKEGPLPPLLIRGPRARSVAGPMAEILSLPSLHYEEQGAAKEVLRVKDAELIAWLEKVQAMRLDLFQMAYGGRNGGRHVHLRAPAPADPWVIEPAEKASARFIQNEVASVRAVGPGRPPLLYWYGRPAPLSFLPGFYFLIRLRLGAEAKFEPEYGFTTAAARTLGKGVGEESAHAALAGALRDEGDAPSPVADPGALRARIQALLDARLEPELSALARLIASPATWMDRRLDTLLRLPDLYADRAEEIVEAFRAARDAKHEAAVILLAKLIAALPDPAFRRVGAPLLKVVNSKRLAGRVKVEGEAGEPPRLEGFRLLIHVPRLYERLGDLGAPARSVVEGLLKLLPHIEALQKAKAKLDGEAEKPPAA